MPIYPEYYWEYPKVKQYELVRDTGMPIIRLAGRNFDLNFQNIKKIHMFTKNGIDICKTSESEFDLDLYYEFKKPVNCSSKYGMENLGSIFNMIIHGNLKYSPQ